jgi:serine/threonine protein kinase/tetratricopeptide (TPR) repeat protein
MSPDFARIRQFFELALEKPESERAAFLDRTCGGAGELREQVEALLAAHEERGDFLAEPMAGSPEPAIETPSGPAPDHAPSGEAAGDVIDRFKLLQEIGEGGMGTVWMAEQFEPVRRKVALKIIKLGMDTKQVVVRFEAERQALALMDHPGIAKVLDGGVTAEGRPYFVMELVKGIPITEFCDEARLGIRERLELFTQVCQAVQHAHQKGIIHRDLKPSNVLVTLHDGVSVPKVIDFGIAKATNQELTQKTLFTEYQQILGTPEYMAPEQASLSALDVDTRADVYSLGVLLYELLTGTKPFDLKTLYERGFEEVLRTIREQDPPKPSTRASTVGDDTGKISMARQLGEGQLGNALRGDLDWIIIKSMEKDRTRRYESASGLAADIGRFLADEPVLATPPSASYRLRKFVRRNRGPVAAGVVVALALVIGVAGTVWGLVRAIDQRERAEAAESAKARELARVEAVKDVITDMITGITPEEARGADTTLLRQIIERTAERLSNNEVEDQEVAATLHRVLSSAYYALSDFEEGERHILRAIEIWTRVLGPDSARVAKSAAYHGLMVWKQGRLKEAREILERQADALDRLVGNEDPSAIAARANLSQVLYRLGEHARAEAMVRELLPRARRSLGDAHPHVGVITLWWANALSTRGRTEEAGALTKEAYEKAVAAGGKDHPDALSFRSSYAQDVLGETDESKRIQVEVVGDMRRILGEGHVETLSATLRLIDLLVERWEVAEAQEHYRRIEPIAERRLRPESRLALAVRRRGGALLARLGRYDEAEQALVETARSARRALGPADPRSVKLAFNCGAELVRMSRFAGAYEVMEPAAGHWAKLWGKEHRWTLKAETYFAQAAQETGRLDVAEPLITRVHADLVRLAGPDHESTVLAAWVVASVHIARGRTGEAETLLTALIERLPPTALRARLRFLLAKLYGRLGRTADAERELRARLATLVEKTPRNMEIAFTKAEIARTLIAQKKFGDAETLLIEAIEDARRIGGKDNGHVPQIEAYLGHVYNVTRRYDKSIPYLESVRERVEARTPVDSITQERVLRSLVDAYGGAGRPLDAARTVMALLGVFERRGRPRPDVEVVRAALYFEDAQKLAEAAELYREAREIRAEKYGRQHVQYIQPTSSLGNVLSKLGRHREAVPFLIEVVEFADRVGQKRFSPRFRLAFAYQQLKEYGKAEATWRSALEVAEGIMDKEGVDYLDVRVRLAQVIDAQGRTEDALKHFEELAPVTMRAQLAHDMTPYVHESLVRLNRRLGRRQQAAVECRRLIKMYEKRHGADHVALDRPWADLGNLYWSMGEYANAERAFRRLHELRLRVRKPNDPASFGALTDLGAMLLAQEEYAQAVPVLERALAGQRKFRKAGHRQIRTAMAWLAQAYHLTGRKPAAAAVLKELLALQLAAAAKPDASERTLRNVAETLLYEGYEGVSDPRRAAALAQRAVETGQRAGKVYWRTHAVLADARHQLGERDAAVQSLERALKIAPKHEQDALKERLAKWR